MKIKKILANEQQLNTDDIMMTFCLNCKTDYTVLARLGRDHDCHLPYMAEHRDVSILDLKNLILTAIPLHLLGNRSTDHHNERQYEHYSDYELWSQLGIQVVDSAKAPIGDKAQIFILRKETKTGGIQPSPFTEDFISLPRRIVMAVLSFFNLEIKPKS